jgi:hypothetical protein
MHSGFDGTLLQTRPKILPGHIMVTYAESGAPHEHLIVLYGFESLTWRPIADLSTFWDRVIPQKGSPVICARLVLGDSPRCDARTTTLAVHRCPLHRDAFKVTLYAFVRLRGQWTRHDWIRHANGLPRWMRRMLRLPPPQYVPPFTFPCMLFSYRFTPTGGSGESSGFTWRPLSTDRAPPIWKPTLTYSGYCVDRSCFFKATILDARLTRDGVVSKRDREVLPQQNTHTTPALGRYSAAVPELHQHSLTISYYV